VPNLGVPDEARAGLVQLAGLDNAAFNRIADVLSRPPPSLRQSRFINGLGVELGKDFAGDIQSLMAAILSVASGREASRYKPAEFAEGVALSKDLKLARPLRNTLNRRLVEVLQIPSVIVTAKAWDLLLENEHNFRSSRVLTDLRPIFVHGHDTPRAGLVLHQLRVTHGNQHSDQDTIITLDDLDLLELMETLNRAQLKAEQLRSALSGTDIKVLKQEP